MKIKFDYAVTAAILTSLAGCGGGGEAAPRLNIVSGHVAFSDAKKSIDAADHSVVVFHPANDVSGEETISGPLIEGAFSIWTEKDGEKILGAPEGDYTVTISPPKSSPKAIPAKYRDPKTTDLTAHVDKGINNLPVMELK
ncbi:MAG: hypothetical protein U0872_06640 [Planctomycetaceae bacterium]